MNTNSDNQLSIRDQFALAAPEMSTSRLNLRMEQQRRLNPHNDYYKPSLLSEDEIRIYWRYEWADMMIEIGKKSKKQ